MTQIELTPTLQLALDLMEDSNQHVFITGKAGTGKSTLLSHFKKTTSKKVAVLAPTGVAALNVGGQTVHSFFKFRPDTTVHTVSRIRLQGDQAKLYKALDAIVIDEVSMLRADLLDCIDKFLRLYGPKKSHAFGGIQMIFIGDLHQLPPVVTSRDRELFENIYKGPYFFDAHVLDEITLYFVELDKIYRQTDSEFINVLAAIRNNVATREHLDVLNQQYRTLEPGTSLPISLTTTNELADRINAEQLSLLSGKSFSYTGVPTGSFNERDFPTAQNLNLKVGAQVMTLNNDSGGKWVNGSIGSITKIYEDKEEVYPIVEVRLDHGGMVRILPHTWELYTYALGGGEEEQLQTQVAGTYRQYPLRLAWAVTIHKSQGKTFDRAIIDLGRGTFSPGQLYVALSRCRTLDGITLKQPIIPRYIMTNPRISEFMGTFKDGMRQVGQADLFGDWD